MFALFMSIQRRWIAGLEAATQGKALVGTFTKTIKRVSEALLHSPVVYALFIHMDI